MKVFVAELKKLLLLFKADPKSLGAGIIPPTILLIAFALTIGNFSSITIAFVNQDTGSNGAILEESVFNQVSPLGGKVYFEKISADYDMAFDLYERGKVTGVVVVGENFSNDLESGKTPSIQYHFNNYNTDIAKNLRLYFAEGILDFYRVTDPDLKIDIKEVINVETQLPWFHIVAISTFMLSFQLGAMVNVLYLFYQEKANSTLYEYRLSPNSIWPSLLARVSLALIAGSIATTINAVFIWLITGINLANFILAIIPPLFVVGLTYIFFTVSVSLLVDSFSGATLSSLLIAILIWFLSGATFLIKNTTGALRAIALTLPNSYGLSQIRGTVFSMDPSVGSGVSFATGWLVMIGYIILTMTISFYLYNRKLARMVV